MSGHELAFVEWLSERTGRGVTPAGVCVGIGDDMAVLDLAGGPILVSTDMLLDGVHFESDRHPWSLVGRKAVACGLSDCAAMAVKPAAALVSVALPSCATIGRAKELAEGMLAMAAEYEVPLVGGDTTCWAGGGSRLAVDVAMLAVPFPGVSPVRRSGALVGDLLYVTGPLGGSRLGHHLEFSPRVREAEALVREWSGYVRAMLDVSDGLSLDAWRLCRSSGVGAALDEASIEQVTADAALEASRTDGRSVLEHVLEDGEDFELLAAVDPAAPTPTVPVFPVGEIVAEGFQLRRHDGSLEPLEPRGYAH